MNELPGPRSPFVDDLLKEVVQVMTQSFGIAEQEAIGRIARDFGNWDLQSAQTEQILGHENASYWAHEIYYGPEVAWWRLPAEALVPRPWP